MKTNELSSGIKNVADIIKKADNLELYGMLLELYANALELQEENKRLQEKLSDKRRIDLIRNKIIRHSQPFITLKDDGDHIYYCAHCWDSGEKLIQLNTNPQTAEFFCPDCKNTGIYDQVIHDQYERAKRSGVIYH